MDVRQECNKHLPYEDETALRVSMTALEPMGSIKRTFITTNREKIKTSGTFVEIVST